MALAGRPANPKPEDVRVGENQPHARTVDPRAAVMTRKYPWETDERGWLNFDNPGQVCTAEKLEMLCDPQVSSLLHLRRSMILMDGVQISPTEGVEPMLQYRIINPKYERAQKTAEFCRWMLCNTLDSFHGVLMQWLSCDWWKNIASELIWREQEWGEYSGKLMLDQMPVYGPEDYLIWRKDGQIIGLENIHEAQTDPLQPRVYPLEKFALNFFRPDRKNRLGTDLAKIAQVAHFMKREGQPEQLKNLAQFGSPFICLFGPESAQSDVPLPSGIVDAFGRSIPLKDENGVPIMVPPHIAMARGMGDGHQNGGYGAFPGGAEAKLLEAQNGGKLFQDFAAQMNWELAVGLLGTGTLTQEQQYGSNATAKTGKETVQTPITTDKTALSDVIKKSICQAAVRYNFPQSYWDVVPTVTCGDPSKPFWQSLLTTFVNALPVEHGFEMFSELALRSGLSNADARRIREQVANGELPLETTVPGSSGSTP